MERQIKVELYIFHCVTVENRLTHLCPGEDWADIHYFPPVLSVVGIKLVPVCIGVLMAEKILSMKSVEHRQNWTTFNLKKNVQKHTCGHN